jgi:uncharacterized Ntn-hydrolase superfamily protein
MRLLTRLAALALVVQPAFATWSIVVVDTATGEVGVACATCLNNFNLIPEVPVIYPGVGAGAAQSTLDTSGIRRLAMWNGFEAGLTPSEILTNLAAISGHQQRQYGVVSVHGPPITFTGNGAGQGKHGVVGTVGTLSYAIQGNLLVGPEPVLAAEAALLNTPGDLGQRMMAGMEAARAMGGDGRCSCSSGAPTSCGAPPPGTWKSAHTAFIIVSRAGEQKGVCNGNAGCANGSYYLKRNEVGSVSDPDPVVELQAKYDSWRASWVGRPDHVKSVVTTSAQQLVADGVSSVDVHVQLIDIDGTPLTTGGAALTLTNLSGAPDVTTPANVVDNGDGTYTFTLLAGATAGADDWELKFDDGLGNVRLWPRLQMPVLPLAELHTGYHTVSAGNGACVPLVVNGQAGPGNYVVLGSSSGTAPGTPLGSFMDLRAAFTIPLNLDPFMQSSLASANTAPFLSTRGKLDASGRAEAAYMPAPGALGAYVGGRLDWCVLIRDAAGRRASTPVGFDVVP